MKITSCFLAVTLLFAAGCARTPYSMAVTDVQGVVKSVYQEGEAMSFLVGWDLSRDEGKVFECSFVNAFSGDVVWKGTAIAPKADPGQKFAQLAWSPPLPDSGIKVNGGEYHSSCNFGNEKSISVPVSVCTPFAAEMTDLNGINKPYFANDEAMKLQIYWDLKHDAGKMVHCSIVNTYDGTVIWQGVATTPAVETHQNMANVNWHPPFPAEGVRLKHGNYSANCNFNNEFSKSIPINITNVRSWP
jgi:hypothetical protein